MEEEEENGSSNIDEEEEEGEGESEIRERKCRNGVSTILRLLGHPGPGDDNDQQLDPWMIRVLKKNTIKETETETETETEEKTSSYSSCYNKKKKKKKKKSNNTKMNKINVRLQYSNPSPPPQLPQNFQSKINELGGWNVGFVIEKRLFSSDVSCGQGRFAFSMNQVVNEFLSDEEKKSLSASSSTEKDIEVKLIDPAGAGAGAGGEGRSMKLTKWNTNYVLKTNWMTVVKDNRLKENTRVQLWSFRVQNNKLYFALIKLQDVLKLDS